MPNYELRLAVQPLSEELDDLVAETTGALYTTHGTTGTLMMDADGEDAVGAARAAIAQLESLGVVVTRLAEDLVTRATIAERASVSPQAVGQWIRNERRDTTPFPAPFNAVAGGVWLWADVNAWLAQMDRTDGLLHPDSSAYDIVNGWLASRRAFGTNAWSDALRVWSTTTRHKTPKSYSVPRNDFSLAS